MTPSIVLRAIFNKTINSLLIPRCIACQCTIIAPMFCDTCLQTVDVINPSQGTSIAFFEYAGAIRKAILHAKFGPDEATARQILSLWKIYFADSINEYIPDADYAGVAFVPLHWRRRITRGFDLSALFARVLAKSLKIPVIDCLVTTRYDEPLSRLSSASQRQERVKNRYRLSTKRLRNAHIILVDDIITSGATLASARLACEASGIRVTACALAITPKEKKDALHQNDPASIFA